VCRHVQQDCLRFHVDGEYDEEKNPQGALKPGENCDCSKYDLEALAKAEKEADEAARGHWRVVRKVTRKRSRVTEEEEAPEFDPADLVMTTRRKRTKGTSASLRVKRASVRQCWTEQTRMTSQT